jgi:hypothetical protein
MNFMDCTPNDFAHWFPGTTVPKEENQPDGAVAACGFVVTNGWVAPPADMSHYTCPSCWTIWNKYKARLVAAKASLVKSHAQIRAERAVRAMVQ